MMLLTGHLYGSRISKQRHAFSWDGGGLVVGLCPCVVGLELQHPFTVRVDSQRTRILRKICASSCVITGGGANCQLPRPVTRAMATLHCARLEQVPNSQPPNPDHQVKHPPLPSRDPL